jgi:undecaprenyl-phosphate 4-deoxy-4-formamido-L-arabinose transferase
VVVPVYNSAANLPALLARLYPVLARLGIPFEVILVNDGSRDRSWEAIAELATTHPWVRGISLARNFGQHNALLCGIRAARHEAIVTMDDDLQHPPEELPRLLAELAEFDVVYGTPEVQQHGLLRDLASRLTKMALESLIGAQNARNVSAFRAFRTCLRDAFAAYSSPNVSIDVLLAWGSTRFTAVKVPHAPRSVGESGYTLGKLLTHTLNMFTGFSAMPLRLAGYLGFACTLLGIATLAWVLVVHALYGSVVPGFAFLASITALFSGAQMFSLGIIGEYLGRVHFRLMDKPPYVVRATACRTDSQQLAA